MNRPIRAACLVAAAVVLLFLLSIPPADPAPDHSYWGAQIGTQFTGIRSPWSWNTVRAFEKIDAQGKPISVLGWGSPFYSARWCNGYCHFQVREYSKVRRHGVIPWLSWGSYDAGSPLASGYTDAQVAAGTQDRYISRWARAAKAWGHPFFLRFDWEMNLAWFPWGVRNNGNTAAAYVAMWRHIHRIFASVGATNATWVWCPNIDPAHAHAPLASLYPGNAYVDWTCLDGYNGGQPWRSFTQLFASSYRLITRAIAPSKPMIIGEIGTTETGGSKALWITQMFSALQTTLTQIRGLLWFDSYASGPGGHYDWPIETSTASELAFAAGIQTSVYRRNVYRRLSRSPVPLP